MPTILTKRIYDEAAASDGTRILIDRLWPRGFSKDRARIDYWAKDVAPSHELRKWYQHDAEKWDEFRRRYHAELEGNADGVAALREHITGKVVTLVFSSKEEKLNNATALKEYIEDA